MSKIPSAWAPPCGPTRNVGVQLWEEAVDPGRDWEASAESWEAPWHEKTNKGERLEKQVWGQQIGWRGVETAFKYNVTLAGIQWQNPIGNNVQNKWACTGAKEYRWKSWVTPSSFPPSPVLSPSTFFSFTSVCSFLPHLSIHPSTHPSCIHSPPALGRKDKLNCV